MPLARAPAVRAAALCRSPPSPRAATTPWACTGCHAIHTSGDQIIFAVKADDKA